MKAADLESPDAGSGTRARLSPELIAALEPVGITLEFTAGDVIFRSGDLPLGLLLVIEGRVRVVREHRGRRRVLHVEERGGSLGEIPLFAGGTYPATAIAAEQSRLLLVRKEELQHVLARHPPLALALLERLARRVRELVTRHDRTETETVAQRLARHLLGRLRPGASGFVSLGMPQRELAEELGTVREVLVRALRALGDDGTLEPLGRARYRVLSAAALEQLAFAHDDKGVA